MAIALTHARTARRAVPPSRAALAVVLLSAALVTGCRQDMHDTPRYEALEESANLPAPEVIAAEITADLEVALEQFAALAEDLK